jgi:glycosylphosphatidylinositol transamidase (GPIT) subunit GPI8
MIRLVFSIILIFKSILYLEAGQNWALLVATSRDYINYRHQVKTNLFSLTKIY